MRRRVSVPLIEEFMQKLAEGAKGPGSVYLVGGSTALLLGIRDQTIDIDIKLDPEPDGVFEAIAFLKNDLDLNIELASPDDFIPAPSDWQSKSRFIKTINRVNFYHYDIATQALAKIQRGFDQDLKDVQAFVEKGYLSEKDLEDGFSSIKPSLIRYPSVDPKQFREKIDEFLTSLKRQKKQNR